jgi:nicotinamidase-related amidase
MTRLLELVLAGRPEKLTDAYLSTLSEAERHAYMEVEQILSRYALVNASSVTPSAGLKSRITESFRARVGQRPKEALLVIDMIRDHLTEGAILEVPRAREIVGALAAKISECRRSGIPIVYVVDEHDPSDPDLEAWGTHAVAGTSGTEVWPDLAPEPSDLIVKKPTYSAFSSSNLEQVLDGLGCDSLILTGCLTEIGIMATATDALQRGYAVNVPPETQAGVSALTEQTTLSLLQIMPPYGAARRDLLARRATA